MQVLPFDHGAGSVGHLLGPMCADVMVKEYMKSKSKEIRKGSSFHSSAHEILQLADPILSMRHGTLVPLPLPSISPPHGWVLLLGPRLTCFAHWCFPTAGSIQTSAGVDDDISFFQRTHYML